ncbi:putative MFS family arabinose efflux permease [Nocardia sp. GAS34]
MLPLVGGNGQTGAVRASRLLSIVLPSIGADLGVGTAAAGRPVTAFALACAVGAPLAPGETSPASRSRS